MHVQPDFDPIADRLVQRQQQQFKVVTTFKEIAERYIAQNSPAWRNSKHATQWSSTLKTYVYPVFGDKDVALVNIDDVLKVLEPIWTTKTETASRIRMRIEAVLDYARALKLRGDDNPARWKGSIEALLPPPSKVRPAKHHDAVPYSQIAKFMQALRLRDGTAARALEFLILTAVRSGEVRGTKWAEIDLDKKVWTIPAERMKAKREHRVPLSDSAVALIGRLARGNADDLLFPAPGSSKPLSDGAMARLLERMGYDETPHGFRSTFRDWAGDLTEYPRDVAEEALAHQVSSKVEAAYRRSDMFDRRRPLMQDWADYVGKPSTSTTPA